MAAQGINIGDGVFSFFTDTTRLDSSLASVEAKAAKAGASAVASIDKIGPAATEAGAQVKNLATDIEIVPVVNPEVPVSIEKVGFSAKEAKAEVGLLGEAIGVNLPRHVRGFLTEIPGVGAALNAAFSITAVGFLVTALVEVTEKASELVAELAFATEAGKETNKSVIDLNTELVALAKTYQDLKDKVDAYGKSALQLAIENQNKTKQSVQELTAQLKEEQKAFIDLEQKINAHSKVVLGANEAYQQWKAGNISFLDSLKGYVVGIDAATLHHKDLDAVENKLIKTSGELKNAHEALKVAAHDVSDETKKEADTIAAAWTKTATELSKAYDEFYKLEKAGFDVNEALTLQADTALPSAAAGWMKIGQAMRAVGIDNVDLTQELDRQTKAVDILFDAYKKGEVSLRTFQQAELSEAQTERMLAASQGQSTKALDQHIASLQRSLGVDTRKEQSYQKLTALDKQFMQTLRQSGSVSTAVWGATADAMGSAVNAYAMGSATIGQALAKMAQAEIASLSERAIIYAIFELGKGFATMFTDPAESASHFTAAAEFGTLGAVGAVVAHTIGGATDSNPSTGSSNAASTGGTANTQQNAATQNQPAPVLSLNVQRFAAGALVSQPTLAIVGDSKSGGAATEAIMPLDDPRAMAKMGGSMGGGDIHVHVKGLISPDNLNKVIKNISKRVGRGQSHLKSSDSMRVTRRSQ